MEAHPPYRLPEGLFPSGLPAFKCCTPLDSLLAGACLNSGVHHPPVPFLEGRGEVKKGRLWRHILHTACQWGCTPLDSLLATRVAQTASMGPCQWGCTPLDSPLATLGCPLAHKGRPEGIAPSGRRSGGCPSRALLIFPLPIRKGARGMVRSGRVPLSHRY